MLNSAGPCGTDQFMNRRDFLSTLSVRLISAPVCRRGAAAGTVRKIRYLSVNTVSGGLARLLAASLLVSGCATVGSTPRQDLAWDIGRACAAESGTVLQRVDPDGKVWVTWRFPDELARFNECMRKRQLPPTTVR